MLSPSVSLGRLATACSSLWNNGKDNPYGGVLQAMYGTGGTKNSMVVSSMTVVINETHPGRTHNSAYE